MVLADMDDYLHIRVIWSDQYHPKTVIIIWGKAAHVQNGSKRSAHIKTISFVRVHTYGYSRMQLTDHLDFYNKLSFFPTSIIALTSTIECSPFPSTLV